MLTHKDNVKRPEGCIKIIKPIDSSGILGPGYVNTDLYKYQTQYALVLWALQEKFGFTYEEATFYCCRLFRSVDPLGFYEDIFGMEYEVEAAWFEYLDSLVSEEELSGYVGPIKTNQMESDAYQWF